MRRIAVLAACLVVVVASALQETTSAQQAPDVTVSPGAGDVSTVHVLHATGFPANTAVTEVLIDPSGGELVTAAQTDGAGDLTIPLEPPTGGWAIGLYRAVVGLSDGESASATFVSGDGQPHLYAEPYLPSPTSAYNLVGIGLQPNVDVEVDLTLTGGQGTHPILAHTDQDGAFSVYAWPAQYHLSFFTVGDNVASIPADGLSVTFRAREHPVGGNVHVAGPITSGAGVPVEVNLRDYARGRYVWGVYARMDGTVVGEFLAGPTDAGGRSAVLLPLAALPAGEYLLATPYDWGETPFSVDPAPTATPAPTVAPTATKVPSHHKKHGKKHKHHSSP